MPNRSSFCTSTAIRESAVPLGAAIGYDFDRASTSRNPGPPGADLVGDSG